MRKEINSSVRAKDVVFGIIIVSHNNTSTLTTLLKKLSTEIGPHDSVVLVDNHPEHLSVQLANKYSYITKRVTSENKGFAAACNLAYSHLPKSVTHVLMLNPDTKPETQSLQQLRTKAGEWSACMGLLVMQKNKVNSAGNAVHISGLSWCNGFLDNPKKYTENAEIFIASGACMVTAKSVWDACQGMYEDYFLYYEDTDFSTQIILNGGTIGLEPSAHIFHDYDYGKSNTKWFYIERNRPIYILRCWPLSVILLLLPYLFFVDIGLWLVSIVERRFVLKLRSTLSLIQALPKTFKSRRQVQKNRQISAYNFLLYLEPKVNTLQLGSLKKFWLLNVFSTAYFVVLKTIFKIFSRPVQ